MNWAGILLLFYLLAGAYIFFALCCGPTQASKNTSFAKFHYYTTTFLFDTFKKCLGERTWNCITGAGDYVINKPNPILQGFYLILVVGGYFLFVVKGGIIQYVPGPYIAAYHIYTAHIAFFMALFFFYKASSANPGVVNEFNRNAVDKHWPEDEVLYPKKECKVCEIERPPRTKHCNICGHCVSRFDHHCPWVNNCIGENNVRYFHGFLLSTAFLVSYIAWVTVAVLMGEIEKFAQEKPRWKPTFVNKFQWAMFYFPMPTPVGLFCAMASVFVYAFWLYHVYLVYRNVTTYESIKRSDYISFVKLYRKRKAIIEDSKKNPPKTEKDKERLELIQEKFAKMPEPIGVSKDMSGKLHLKNHFQKGFLSNVKEVLFPNPVFAQKVERLTSVKEKKN